MCHGRLWRSARAGVLISQHAEERLPRDPSLAASTSLHLRIATGYDQHSIAQGVEAYPNYVDLDGAHMTSSSVLGGFSAIMEALAAPLLSGGLVNFDTPVTSVNWGGPDGDSATVVTAQGATFSAHGILSSSNAIILATASSSDALTCSACVVLPYYSTSHDTAIKTAIFEACESFPELLRARTTAIVISCSLVALRNIRFVPALPETTTLAMAGICLGAVEKVFFVCTRQKENVAKEEHSPGTDVAEQRTTEVANDAAVAECAAVPPSVRLLWTGTLA